MMALLHAMRLVPQARLAAALHTLLPSLLLLAPRARRLVHETWLLALQAGLPAVLLLALLLLARLVPQALVPLLLQAPWLQALQEALSLAALALAAMLPQAHSLQALQEEAPSSAALALALAPALALLLPLQSTNTPAAHTKQPPKTNLPTNRRTNEPTNNRPSLRLRGLRVPLRLRLLQALALALPVQLTDKPTAQTNQPNQQTSPTN